MAYVALMINTFLTDIFGICGVFEKKILGPVFVKKCWITFDYFHFTSLLINTTYQLGQRVSPNVPKLLVTYITFVAESE